ncbi:MAG: Gfo/Idh/MocA family oxidoreductase [Planctomycetes bacterium]|nr:Gfo/Idh/MocA family oxidoreductase [Planctomycetota bacterium]
MAKTYRVGVIGMVHDHVWKEAKYWQACPNTALAAAADPNEPLRDRMKTQYGVQALYADWREMIEKEELDIIQLTVENNAGAEVLEGVAPKGLHVVSEKPMAARLEQADRMLKAAEDAGTLLVINWPIAWSPAIRTAARLVKEGAIGQPFQVRTRMAHCGPKELGCSEYFYGWLYDAEKNGAGALMDYCCYGAAFCRHLLGMPKAVQGVMGCLVKEDFPVDDNAAITMIYDNAFGITEASWTQVPSYHDTVILGSEGTLITDEGKLWMATKEKKEKTLVDLDDLPEGERNGPEYMLHCLETGTEPEGMCAAKNCRDSQEILEAGLLSAQEGRRIELPINK